MRTAALFSLITAAASLAETHVFTIHGFGSARIFMVPLCRYIRNETGYTVHNWGYRSLTRPIPQVARVLGRHLASVPAGDTVHFVTHSMGALVVRSFLGTAREDTSLPFICRIVMMGPPNRGAEIADFFSRSRLMRWMLGPNLETMTTDSSSFANTLYVPEDKEVGVIIGQRYDGRGYNPFIGGDDDGYLSPRRALLGSEKDHIRLPVAHVRLPQSRAVKENVVAFLKTGRFIGSAQKPGSGP